MKVLRSKLKHIEELAKDTLLALQYVGKSQILQKRSIPGAAAFTKDIWNLKIGPQLAIAFHSRTRGDQCALICGERSWTYRELDQEINQLSRGLVSMGVSGGDAVAIMLPNCSEHLVAQETMPRIGVVAAQVGYRLKGDEIAYIFDNADPQIVIYHYRYEAEIRAANVGEKFLEVAQFLVVGAPPDANTYGERYEDLIGSQDREMPILRNAGDGGVIVYTSGTTGKPKGATRTWKDTGLVSITDLMAKTGIRSNDVHLVVCPLYHSAALAFAKMLFGLGATVVLADHFDAEAVLQCIESEKITCSFMVPTMLVRLNALPPAVRQKYDTSSLRWVMSGAAPLATATANEFQDNFGPILHNFYGATETGVVSHAGPEDHLGHPGSVGRPLRGNQLKIIDEHGEELNHEEVGELYVSNGMLIAGYHKNTEATLDSQRNGFFSVGDMASIDSDGYLHLASRKHDMVISGGVNIYPREIENRLHEHPDVLEAAVTGIPDPEWGECVGAFVVVREGEKQSAEALRSYCKEHLASYKQPRHIIFLESLPRNETGKVLKRKLQLP